MKTIGILGGFGAETTARFYSAIVEKSERIRGVRPRILVYSAPVPVNLEQNAVKNGRGIENFLPLLLDGAKALQESDFIVLPCNTLHVFIDEVRNARPVPVVSILEEAQKEIRKRKLSKVGILSTAITSRSGIVERAVRQAGADVVKLDYPDHQIVSEIISAVLRGERSGKLKDGLEEIVKKLEHAGAEAVILGCTDLQLVMKQEDFNLPLIDTMNVLAEAAARLANDR